MIWTDDHQLYIWGWVNFVQLASGSFSLIDSPQPASQFLNSDILYFATSKLTILVTSSSLQTSDELNKMIIIITVAIGAVITVILLTWAFIRVVRQINTPQWTNVTDENNLLDNEQPTVNCTDADDQALIVSAM